MFALSPSHTIITTPSPELLAAYEATLFVVDGAHVIRMREPLPAALVAWLRLHNTTCGAILGAEYPFSQPTSTEENDRRHTMLITECASRNIPWLEAVGIGDAWQERHVAVAGVDDTDALDFCRRYEQNAVVVLDVDAGAWLVVADKT
jgi:hypothetical protein